ncbi:hypothetical protein GQ43DRAFT_73199 [Delitschia confertaspora ATCC 74209]|uniref:Mannosyltransferase n=1 Tax=Delitschia confertaspora ATCC 74209 TaxID=1513339 RepID=A0A9P4MY19_9PLEO|nr:hypothetical protein GQ43DRAFT_73199 [Delitschia confertaspora ATCC 74209]
MPQSDRALSSPSRSAHQTRATSTGASGREPRSPPLASYRASTQHVFLLLLAFRIVNALTLRTFFQPDEYFQSLEPAWQIAFGRDSGAWITWEWRNQLRSSLHPAIFAGVYRVAASLASLCRLSLPVRAELLIAAPKVIQALFAALLDCYTWKLTERVYGRGSRTALVALALSVCSPWQWFCSTRTLSNCLETTLTTIAVYYWPWRWPGLSNVSQNAGNAPRDGKRQDQNKQSAKQNLEGSVFQLRVSLLLAAVACILRPTNLLIWLCISIPTLWRGSTPQSYVLIREILFCGSAVLACAALLDRLYYGIWSLPPLRFLYFNVAQSLAVFYGRNRPDYYLTEGLPLLLTTALPFAIVGTWQALRGTNKFPHQNALSRSVPKHLAYTILLVTFSMSLISHKEVRFLYPLLPILHLLSAPPISSLFPSPLPSSRKAILAILLLLNLLIAGYTSQVHQRGVIDVLAYLRHKHETAVSGNDNMYRNTTVGFLMPCHSTPWRSHLNHPGIEAWALTCEPPLEVPLSQRSHYLDEADQFYNSPGPVQWLEQNMEDREAIRVSGSRTQRHWARLNKAAVEGAGKGGKRAWPQNLVFFEALEGIMQSVLEGTGYRECWRGFNSHWHDDRRRTGDVVVWCWGGN